MRVGVGLPNAVPGVSGAHLLAWARRAEAAGFASLATVDRLNYPTADSLTLLAAAAGATERIDLLANVVLAPAYEAAHLAKRTGTLARLAPGRLRLGLGIGTRADDYAVAGQDFATRGRRLDELLETLARAWRGEPLAPGVGAPVGVVPAPVEVPLLLGGQPRFAAPRVARWGAGWTIGGGGVELARAGLEAFRDAYREAGGTGTPPITALHYVALGANEDESRATLRAYYAHLTDHVDGIVEGAARSPEAVREVVAAYADLGVDELVLVATAADPGQVEPLAAAALG